MCPRYASKFVSFLVRLRTYQHPGISKWMTAEIFWTINKLWNVHTTEEFWHILSSAWLPQKPWDLHKESYCACAYHFSLEFLFQTFYPLNTCAVSYSQNVCSHACRSSWKVLLLLNKCILNLDVLENFGQPPPTPNFMKIQPPFPDCDMQMGGHTDTEKIVSTFCNFSLQQTKKAVQFLNTRWQACDVILWLPITNWKLQPKPNFLKNFRVCTSLSWFYILFQLYFSIIFSWMYVYYTTHASLQDSLQAHGTLCQCQWCLSIREVKCGLQGCHKACRNYVLVYKLCEAIRLLLPTP